jgi:hypothetical protein
MRGTFLFLTAIVGLAAASSLETRSASASRTGENAAPGIVLASSADSARGRQARTRVHDTDFPEQDSETIRKSFDLGAANRSLELDNVTGSITVAGSDANQVQLVVTRVNRAASKEKLTLAKKEVTLDITQDAGTLKLYVNGPFRCRCDNNSGFSWRREREYSVTMDFELRVPRAIALRLSTVNAGEVRVSDVRGDFDVRNVNGGIEMQRVAGSGTAHTVNGEVKVLFTENPHEASSFKSINGDIELRFLKNLAADFRFKTFNGRIYSDFIVTSLPARNIERTQEGRKTVSRADRFSGGRVGAGGAEIKVENLNGDIRILEAP